MGKLSQNNLKSLSYFREGRLIAPDIIDNYLAAAEIYYNNHEYKKAIELTQDGIALAGTARWCTSYQSDSYFPYWILGMSNYYLDNYFLGLGYLTIAVNKNPTKELIELQQNLIIEIKKREKIS